jgi:DNA transposition AAA+ family ATPase
MEIVETRQIRDVLRMAQSVMDSLQTGPIGQLVGESGTGKTRAGKLLVERLGAVRVCCLQGISNKVLAAKIHAAFGGEKAPASANTLVGKLETLVSGRLLVVDEANHLRWQQLELLRYLADEAGMGLILIGTDLMERPFKEGRTATYLAQLAGRIGAKRVRFERLTDLEEVAGYMIKPHFGKVDKATASAFHQQARGYWRDAAELAAACRRVMETQGLAELSPVVVEAAANWMAPVRLAA